MTITIEIPTDLVTACANAALKTAFTNGRPYGEEGAGHKLVGRQVADQLRDLDIAPIVAEELRKQVTACVREVVSEELRKRIKAEVKTLAKDGFAPSIC